MAAYKNYDEFYSDCISKGLIPLDSYEGPGDFQISKRFKCVLCGKEYRMQPRAVSAKEKYGCRGCAGRKTHEQFLEDMKNVDPNIEILSEYKTSKEKVLCRCTKCGYEWEQRPNDLLMGIGCLKCNKRVKISDEEFKDEFYKKEHNIELLEPFVNHKTPILCKCKIDQYEWRAYPYDLLKGRSGCRKCNGSAPYTLEEFKDVLYKVNPNIIVIGEYINSKTPILCRCAKCGYEWKAQPTNMLNNGTGCPNCKNRYKLEDGVELYLNNHNISFCKTKKFDDLRGVGGKPLSYDFYIPSNNCLVECQGIQHKQPVELFGGEERFKIQKEHDKRKKDYAEKHNYNFCEIWYNEYNKIDEILNNVLVA